MGVVLLLDGGWWVVVVVVNCTILRILNGQRGMKCRPERERERERESCEAVGH